jgi:hypothetical protein
MISANCFSYDHLKAVNYMILVMNRSPADNDAVNALDQLVVVDFDTELDLSNIHTKEDKLFIVDLAADAEFQQLPGEQMAKELIKAKLPATITKIYLLVSDVSAENRLYSFASAMTKKFAEFGRNDMQIMVPSDYNYKTIYLVPPGPAEGLLKDEWKVYGMQAIGNTPKFFQQEANKELLWHGKNISEYYENSQRIVAAPTRQRHEF